MTTKFQKMDEFNQIIGNHLDSSAKIIALQDRADSFLKKIKLGSKRNFKICKQSVEELKEKKLKFGELERELDDDVMVNDVKNKALINKKESLQSEINKLKVSNKIKIYIL